MQCMHAWLYACMRTYIHINTHVHERPKQQHGNTRYDSRASMHAYTHAHHAHTHTNQTTRWVCARLCGIHTHTHIHIDTHTGNLQQDA